MSYATPYNLANDSLRSLIDHYWREYGVRIIASHDRMGKSYRLSLEVDLRGMWVGRSGQSTLCTDVNCTEQYLMASSDKDFVLAQVIQTGFLSLNRYTLEQTGKDIYGWAANRDVALPAYKAPKGYNMREKQRKELLEQVAEMVMDRGLPKTGTELARLCDEIKSFVPQDKKPLPRGKSPWDEVEADDEVPF